MSTFPLEPQLAKMLIVSPEFKCSNEILSIAAMLSGSSSLLSATSARLATNEPPTFFFALLQFPTLTFDQIVRERKLMKPRLNSPTPTVTISLCSIYTTPTEQVSLVVFFETAQP